MIKLEGNDIIKIFLGNTELKKVYLGDKVMFPYDVEIEYLESDSSAYIDTKINGNNNNLRIEVHFLYSTFVAYGAVFGNYVSDSYNGTRLILHSQTNKALSCTNTICTTAGNTFIDCSVNAKHYVNADCNRVIIDYTTITVTNKEKGTENNGDICLFNRSLTNNIKRDIGLRIYDFKIYDGETLVRDLIPVRKGGVGYMYDKVSGQLFGNVGTGSFILGNDIEVVG